MNHRLAMKSSIPLALAALGAPSAARAEPARWVPLWTASPQPLWEEGAMPFATGLPPRIAGTTVEQPLTLAMPARRIRAVFSNRYAQAPLDLADGQVRCLDPGAPPRATPLTFAAAAQVRVPAGGSATSDAAEIAGCRRIAVRIRFAGDNGGDFHWDGRETSRYTLADGSAGVMTARLALAAVHGDAPARGVVVAVGDSITDGNGAPVDAMARWPDYLAQMLAGAGIAVVNAGISGNRLLEPGMGRSVVERVRGDVFALPQAGTAIMLIGTNDIAWPGTPFAPHAPAMTLRALQDGVRAVAGEAELRGTRLVVATIAPFAGALPGTPMAGTYWTAEKDALRRAFNAWLRGEGGTVEVFDLDRLLADPADPRRLLPAYDSGDHLHPGAAGNRAIAEALAPLILSGERP